MARKEHQNLFQIFANGHLLFAVCAAAELGIADLIPAAGDRAVKDLAAASGCNEEYLYRMLRMMASHGFFRETRPRHFALTPDAEAMRSDDPESLRSGWRMFHHMMNAQSGLEQGLRQGVAPFELAYGQGLFPYIAANPSLAPVFDAGMTSFHGPETQAMLDAYDFSGIGTLADIGGGNGGLLAAALKKHPAMRGLLFDLDHVIGRAKPNLEAAGVANRCRMEAGSFFASIPSGADAYLFRHILHDWTDEQAHVILTNCRAVIPEEGRLLIVEVVVPLGNDPSIAKDMDFLMMMYPGGKERTKEEYANLFASSGFRLKGVTPTCSKVSVIEGQPV